MVPVRNVAPLRFPSPPTSTQARITIHGPRRGEDEHPHFAGMLLAAADTCEFDAGTLNFDENGDIISDRAAMDLLSKPGNFSAERENHANQPGVQRIKFLLSRSRDRLPRHIHDQFYSSHLDSAFFTKHFHLGLPLYLAFDIVISIKLLRRRPGIQLCQPLGQDRRIHVDELVAARGKPAQHVVEIRFDPFPSYSSINCSTIERKDSDQAQDLI